MIRLFQFFCIILSLQPSSFLNSSRHLNDANLNDESSKIDSVMIPILINKQIISLTSKCKENPLLKNISHNQLKIAETLNTNPMANNLEECSIGSTTCCNSKTYKILLEYFSSTVIPNRIKIFKSNLKYFELVLEEHKRTLIKGFKFNKDQFNTLFSFYQSSIKELYTLAEEIVKESLKYKWNSFCSYVCNYEDMKDNLCNFYNLTYSYNNTNYFDIEYECAVHDEANLNIIKQKSYIYLDKIRNFNTTIDKIYDKILSEIDLISDMNPKTRDIMNNYSNTTYRQLLISLNDGFYSSRSNADYLLCDNTNVKFFNKDIPNFSLDFQFHCEKIIDNFCYGLDCLDDVLMQFRYSSKDRDDFELLLSNSNYFRFVNRHNNLIVVNKMKKEGFNKDAYDLIDKSIVFFNASFYFSYKFILYMMTVLVFLIL